MEKDLTEFERNCIWYGTDRAIEMLIYKIYTSETAYMESDKGIQRELGFKGGM